MQGTELVFFLRQKGHFVNQVRPDLQDTHQIVFLPTSPIESGSRIEIDLPTFFLLTAGRVFNAGTEPDAVSLTGDLKDASTAAPLTPPSCVNYSFPAE